MNLATYFVWSVYNDVYVLSNVTMTRVFLVSNLNYKTSHISNIYRCSSKKSDHTKIIDLNIGNLYGLEMSFLSKFELGMSFKEPELVV